MCAVHHDDLPQHIKGAALWEEIDNEEGYWVYDNLGNQYLAWYFIGQDTRTGHWVATNTVPTSYNLGRPMKPQFITAIKAGDSTVPGCTQSSRTKTGDIYSLAAMSTTATALMLAGTKAPSTQVPSFFSKPGKGLGMPRGGPPPSGGEGGGSRGPPAGPSGRGGAGGGGPPGAGATPGGGGGGGSNGKLTDTFMNEFNLYQIANIDADQMVNPMKRAALMLRFIKGPNIRDWTKKWTNWMIGEFQTGRPTTNEHYWMEVSQGFQLAFQDSGARERAEHKLQLLSFISGDVDTFIAQFEALAAEATYRLDDKPTLSLYATKLPFKMVDHIYKVICPVTFHDWAEATCQYHQDNLAVQNLRGFNEDKP
ncbi:hypothetical protein H4582DRAFT_2061150 [Lactarius indigo]|nr:hypothetical protein H4582DRAFT_2061150 [Lactarius indigo]